MNDHMEQIYLYLQQDRVMRAYSLPENQRVLRLAKSDLMTQYQELSNNARFRETGTKKMRAIGIKRIGVARITGFYCTLFFGSF